MTIYELPLPITLNHRVIALPLDKKNAFHEQAVHLAALFVNDSPMFDFRNVNLDDLEREDKQSQASTNPLLDLVLAEVREELISRRAGNGVEILPLS